MITIIQNGLVIDPYNKIESQQDVAIEGEIIKDVGKNLSSVYPHAKIVDASGTIITPGLIDIHVHVMMGFGDFCVPADAIGVKSGVTTIVDAGTSSTSLFGMARSGIIDQPSTKTRVLAFMDPCKIYIATSDFICHKLMIASDINNLDIGLTKEVVAEHKDVIVGFKVRAVSVPGEDPSHSPFLEGALGISDDLPVMVHFGGFPHTAVIPPLTLLSQLRKGDIVTHAFRAGSGILDHQNNPLPTYIDAYERGVVMDIGHSSGDFHFGTAKHLMSLGFQPKTISTDLNAFNFDGPVYNLTETISKIWALGASLTDVIAMVTSQAAEAIHKEELLGSLCAGRVADISMLKIEEGEFTLNDGFEKMETSKRLVAEGCWRKGEWHAAEHRGSARVTQPFNYQEAI